MPNTSVRAAAEGMPNVNRRNALALAGSGIVAALATVAAPTRAVACTEAPVTRVNRLAFELSGAMDDWMADLGVDGVPDRWKAHIYPASQSTYPVGFEHLGRPVTGTSKVAQLEAAFQAEWQRHLDMLPEHDAAEQIYFEERSKLVKPVMKETTQEEIEAIRRLTIGEMRDFKSFGSAAREYAEAQRAYNKAEWLVRRRTGFTKIDRAFARQLDRAQAAANRLMRCPAQSFADIEAKARVHRVWQFEGDDINHIMADIARIAGRGGVA